MSRPVDPPPPEPTPWDRVGAFFEDVAAVGATMANRNMKLWMSPPDPTRDGPERWQQEWSRWMQAATENTQDISALWLGGSPSQRMAHLTPTVYAQFESRTSVAGVVSWILTEQVVIPVPWGAIERLPQDARIELAGSDPAGAEALRRSLRARLGSWRMSYVLESFDLRDLRPGTYVGMVHVEEPTPRPIANLYIVVRGPQAPTAVPTVVLRWGIAVDDLSAAARDDGPRPLPPQRWTPSGPILLRAQGPAGGRAHVELAGRSGAQLASVFDVRADPSTASYRLQAGAEPPDDVEGFFTGSVLVDGPVPEALAQLQVIVQARVPTADG